MRHYWNPEKCHNRMGICYSKLGKHAEAFKEYDAVLKINPNDAVGFCNRGRKHLALRRYTEAEADALMSLKLNPKHKTSQQLLLGAPLPIVRFAHSVAEENTSLLRCAQEVGRARATVLRGGIVQLGREAAQAQAVERGD